jgi:23S rRNA pseudouridine2605 synthase
VRSERSGNSPRGGRGRRPSDGRPPSPGQPQPGAGRGGSSQRRPRAADTGPARGAPRGGPPRGGASRPPRTGGQGGGFQRRTSSTSGWTTVRPWRPPRDDADEPMLDDDDSQPNWDTIPADRRSQRPPGAGAPRPAAGRGRSRPPAWPGGSPQGGRRPANDPAQSPRGGNTAAPRARRPASNQRQNQRPPRNTAPRSSTWMRPDSAPPDEE